MMTNSSLLLFCVKDVPAIMMAIHADYSLQLIVESLFTGAKQVASATIPNKSFKLIDVSVPNTNEMCNASQLAAKLLHHQSSCASRLAACAQRLKLHKTSCVFHLVAPAKRHNKSNAFAFRLIVRFIQKSFQSRLHQDLVDLSLSNTFSISKLDSISIKAKSNSAMFNDLPMSQQKEMIHF